MRRMMVAVACVMWAEVAAAQVGQVAHVHGQAHVQRGAEQYPLKQGSQIMQGDTVITGADGVAEIVFEDDSHFTVGNHSQVVIDQFIYEGQDENNRSDIRIVKGVFRFASGKIARHDHSRVRYHTPVATIGIRGSEAFGEVKANGQTLLGMSECCVDVTNNAGHVALNTPNSFSMVASPYAPPTYPAQCDAAWLNRTAAALGAQQDDRLYAQADSLADALLGGQYALALRYRMEHVRSDAFAHDATANTLRTVLDYKTARFHGLSAVAGLEVVGRAGDAHYNDGFNGHRAYPTIADADTVELDQLYVAYEGLAATHATVGRQRLAYDNQRFVGLGAFRQDSQSFDAITLTDRHLQDTQLGYAYIAKVHGGAPEREAAGKADSDSHLLRISYSGLPVGTLTTYGYLLDLDDTPRLSSQSYGARLAGTQALAAELSLDYALEYARQYDYASSPLSYGAAYGHAYATAHYRALDVGAGYERLGSEGGVASFQFPLGTRHAFNGDADLFTTTPADGLRDAYVTAAWRVADETLAQGVQFSAAYHDYAADVGGRDYGAEVDAGIGLPFLAHYTAELRIADYDGQDGPLPDTQKIWLTLGAMF